MAGTFFSLLASRRFLQDNLLLDDSNVDELKDSALIPAATDVPQEHDLWHLWDPTDEWMFRERFAICMFYALSIAVQDRIRSNHSMDYRRSTGLLESRECTNPRQGTFSTLSSEVIGMITNAYGETVHPNSFYKEYIAVDNTALQYLRKLRLVNKTFNYHATRELFRHVWIEYDEKKSRNCRLMLHPNNPLLRYAQHVRSVTIRVAIWTDSEDEQCLLRNIDSHKSLVERFTMFMDGFPHLERLEVVFTTIGAKPLEDGLKLYVPLLLTSLKALVALLYSPAATRLSSLWLSLPFWFTLDYLEQLCLTVQEENGRTLQDALPKLTDFRLDIQELGDYHKFDELGLLQSQSLIGHVFLSQLVQCNVLHLSFGVPYLISGKPLLAFRRLKELGLERTEVEAEQLVAIIKYNRKTLSSLVLFDIDLAGASWEEVFVALGTLPELTCFGLCQAGYNFEGAGESIAVHDDEEDKVADLNSMNIRDYHALGDLQRLVVERRMKANIEPMPPDTTDYPGYRRMCLPPLATLADSKEESLEAMRRFLGITLVAEDLNDN